MARTLLQVNGVSKRFCRNPKLGGLYAARDIVSDAVLRGTSSHLRPGEFWAVRDVSFQLKAGEVVGMIGHNGAGKSTLISLVTGVLRPTKGHVDVSTKKVVMMSHQGGLDLHQTGRENVINQLSLNGMAKQAIFENVEAVINFAEIGGSIDAPVGTYSWGMKLRLLFAMYSRLNPDLFVIDEALNGGDLRFRRKFQTFLNQYIAKGGSILLASHDLFSVQSLCSSCLLMNQGELVSVGEPVEIIDRYQKLVAGDDTGSQPMVEHSDNLSLFEELGATAPVGAAPDVVRIDSVAIAAPGDKPLVPGGAAVVTIKFSCRETVSAAACTVLIQAASAVRIAMVTTIQPELREGGHVIHCFIENLPLIPAKYSVLVSFTEPDQGVVLGIKGYYDKPVPFEISAPADKLTTLNRFFSTFVHLPASWTSNAID